MSSAVDNAVKHAQKKTSNIAVGYFNSYDSFDAKRLYSARPTDSRGTSIEVPVSFSVFLSSKKTCMVMTLGVPLLSTIVFDRDSHSR